MWLSVRYSGARCRAWRRRRAVPDRRGAGRGGKGPVRGARGHGRQAQEENYPVPHGRLKRTLVWVRYARPLVAQVAQNTPWPFSAGLRIDDEVGWAGGFAAYFRLVLVA